jgi:hypothetical protein
VNGSDDKVVISVKDSGLGIPAEDIPHLFQKFYRVNNVDRQSIGGTGLGLYLSRRLAEVMGGRLWVESVYKQGSTFFLELPRINSQDAERLKAEQAAAAAQAPAPAAAPVMPVMPAAPATPAAQPAPASPTSEAPSAPNVPRGENLTREQIAAKVRELEGLARSQQSVAPRPTAPQPPSGQAQP